MRRVASLVLAAVRFLCAALFICAAVINFANVVGRYVFAAPIVWAEEVMVLLMLWFVFLGGILVTWDNAHLRMDAISAHARGFARATLNWISALVVLFACAFVGWIAFGVSQLMMSMDQRTVVANVPVAVGHGAIFFGFSLMGIAALVRLFFSARYRAEVGGLGHLTSEK